MDPVDPAKAKPATAAKDADPAAPAAPAAEAPETAASAPESGPAVDPVGVAIERRVQAWLYANIAGSPIARDVNCWNHLVGAIPALVEALKETE